MTDRQNIDRIARALAVALAGLALAAPAASARALGSDGPWGWPHETRLDQPAATSTTMDNLTEEQVLASRGQGAPLPAPLVAAPVACADLDANATAGGALSPGLEPARVRR